MDTTSEQDEPSLHLHPDSRSDSSVNGLMDSVRSDTGSRPALSFKEAARACSVSESKIKRMHYSEQGSVFANAWREDGPDGPGTGRWVIPIGDLIQAGLQPNAYESNQSRSVTQGHEPLAHTLDLQSKLSQSEADRERLRYEVLQWQGIAEARGRAMETMELAMRALSPGTLPAVTYVREERPKRKRWWRR